MSTLMDLETVIADADREYPALYQLFGGYFHQDWLQEYGDPEAALRAFVVEAPPDAVRAAGAEVDRLLAAGFDDASLAALLERGFDCNFVPAAQAGGPAAWLREVRAALQR
jgi:CdiI immunity protein